METSLHSSLYPPPSADLGGSDLIALHTLIVDIVGVLLTGASLVLLALHLRMKFLARKQTEGVRERPGVVNMNVQGVDAEVGPRDEPGTEMVVIDRQAER